MVREQWIPLVVCEAPVKTLRPESSGHCGTKRRRYLEENVAAADLSLSPAQLEALTLAA